MFQINKCAASGLQCWYASFVCAGKEKWRACQAWLEHALDNRPFFGEGYSAGDCALMARFGGAEAYGSGVTADFPALSHWYDGLAGRPSWQVAYPTSFITTE